jgi:hypothetical protein
MKTELQGDKLPIDSLATLNDDNSLLMLGIVPVAVILVLGLLFFVLQLYRRSKNWNELGEAMRLDDGDQPVGSSDFDTNFSTRNISRLEPTIPAKRLEEDDHPQTK